MTTITFDLTEPERERLERAAHALGKEPSALLNEHRSDIVEDLLEDLEDMAIAVAQSRAYDRGELKGIPFDEARARWLATDADEEA